MKQKYVGLTGNEAVATAFKQGRPHVASAFPITPQTEMMHKFADFVANGAREPAGARALGPQRSVPRPPAPAPSPPPVRPASP